MMGRYQLKIELLSDMCVSDGGVYNSSLDTDICYDRYGFPFIPARRIKGCLRECGQELCDWGMTIPVSDLFGDKGADTNRAKVRIGNAYPEHYDEMVRQAKEYEGNLIFHPQNVLDHFSYIRTQTAVDYDTGVADPTSLRTIRVADKGLVFLANVDVDDRYYESLNACCDTFTNIGIARTRGLGEIRATLVKGTEKPKVDTARNVHAPYVPGAMRLDYELFLEEPVICKSTNGGESRSLDYIDGGKMLGLIAQEIRRQGGDFLAFMRKGEFFCSNAYLAVDGERCLEVPANCYSIKNDHQRYVEKCSQKSIPKEAEKLQLNMMKHCYVRMDSAGNLHRETVRMEERYHHRRPEDKSIGRAAEEASGDSRFYQMSSIEAGQRFAGYVTGTAEQIQTVYRSLSGLQEICLGYSHSSEYGKTQIKVTGLKTEVPIRTAELKDFMVKLESPVILYNDRAFYSTDIADLDAEIRTVLGFSNTPARVKYIDRYVNYTTVGGYNVTWNMRKPTIEAFDKGTVLLYHLEEPVSVTLPGQVLIGERVSGGFGEVSVRKLEMGEEGRILLLGKQTSASQVERVHADPGSLAEALCSDLFHYYVKMRAVSDVKNLSGKDAELKTEQARPTVSNMLLMCRENSSMNAIAGSVEKRYGRKSENKEDKLKLAGRILDFAEKRSEPLVVLFSEKYHVADFEFSREAAEYLYLEAFLQQLKYSIREREAKGKQKEEA
ncbi:MAG: hypothetical protein LIO96_04865 [Lachnospiraceae bacterium]|nr:hypothetical protein [Lachnospiraceae bacterium]